MKKSLCTFLAAALLLTVAAAAPAALASDGPDDPVTLLAYSTGSEDSVLTKTLLEYARLVEEASDGAIRLEVTCSGLLGPGAQAVTATGNGAIDILLTDTAAFAAASQPVLMLGLPLLFDDAEQAVRAANSEAGAKLFGGFVKNGLVFLAEGSAGMRNVCTTGVPVQTALDAAGLGLSVPEDGLCVDFWTTVGAAPAVAAPADLPAAPNNGAAVAADIAPLYAPTPTPAPTETPETAEVPPEGEAAAPTEPTPAPPSVYFTSLGYMWQGITLAASKTAWYTLTADERAILQEQAAAAAQYSLEVSAAAETDALAVLEDAGLVLLDPNLPTFRTALGGLPAYYDRYAGQPWYDRGLLDGLLAAK